MDTIERARNRWGEAFINTVQMIRAAGTDSLPFFAGGYLREGGYSLQQTPEEFAALVLLLKHTRRPASVLLEIGSASGGTARFLHERVQFHRILSIDDGSHLRYGELVANFENLPVEHLCVDSHGTEAREWLVQRADQRVDVAFIDGDHSAEGVWQDIVLTLPHLRYGSQIVFHDIVAMPGVSQAWERGARKGLWVPFAEYVGPGIPGLNGTSLGIGVGIVL